MYYQHQPQDSGDEAFIQAAHLAEIRQRHRGISQDDLAAAVVGAGIPGSFAVPLFELPRLLTGEELLDEAS